MNSSSDNPTDEPKLIIDEDWKTQVQREKEKLKREQAAETANIGTTGPGEDSETNSSSAEPAETATTAQSEQTTDEPLPPASFELLVTSLATQAAAALGQVPGDDGQPLPVSLPYAKHFIDLIAMLETKTQGNLSDTEKSFLGGILHQLRMMFVNVSQQTKH